MRVRQTTLSAVALLGATFILPACITHNPVRTYDEVNHERPRAECPSPPKNFAMTSIAQLQAPGSAGDQHRTLVGCASEEIHAPNGSGKYPHNGFRLHVLEFDDDGVPWNAEQQTRTLNTLEDELRKPSMVVVFVHGWKNDASVCNGNLSCFRATLEILSKAETSFAGSEARQVVGVYIGWRGGTLNVKGLNAVSFWGRKHTAHVIGDNGGVTAVIQRLRAMVVAAPRADRTNAVQAETSMVLIGHSFGGALLFSALSTSLNASVGEAITKSHPAPVTARSPEQEKMRPPIGPVGTEAVCVRSTRDLLVLVNPAMEASRFTNLANTRNLHFKDEQVPMFMTLASEADWAVGGFFPVGQAFGTLARAARSRDFWLRMDKGFGMYEPFLTHRVVVSPAERKDKNGKPEHTPLEKPARASGECACASNLSAAGDRILDTLQSMYETRRAAERPRAATSGSLPIASFKLAGYQEMASSRLEPIRDVDPNNPFLMASIDPEIVNGHSDIFNPRFMDFMIEYIVRTELKRTLVKGLPGACTQ